MEKSKGSWKAKKESIEMAIKAISKHYGGDNEGWLQIYINEIITEYYQSLEVPMQCFEDILKIIKYITCNKIGDRR